jgi:hypothetical protein
MRIWVRIAAAAATMFLSGAGAALADPSPNSPFTLCDGYGPPNRSGDGMTRYALALGFWDNGGGNTTRDDVPLGAEGIAACRTALADRGLIPRHWMRRVNLLRALAIHQLATGANRDALATLDQAQALVPADADHLYRRSLGMGLDLTRALALRLNGDLPAAQALATRAVEGRVYSRQGLAAAAMVLYRPVVERGSGEETILRNLSRLYPNAINALFLGYFQAGRFEEAAALCWPPRGADFRGANPLSDQAGECAYALAATHRAAEARAMLQYVRMPQGPSGNQNKLDPPARVEPNVPPPTVPAPPVAAPPTAGRVPSQGAYRQAWTDMVEDRIHLDAGEVDWVVTRRHAPFLPNRATVDIIEAILAHPTPESRAIETRLRDMRQRVLDIAEPSVVDMLPEFFEALPDAETRERIPVFRESRRPWLAMEGSIADAQSDGWRARETAGGGVEIEFRALAGSTSVVEEMALLRAAQMAIAAGHHGLIISDRRDNARTLSTTTAYGGVLRTDPMGYESHLEVIFCDPNHLPEGYANAGWRVIDADAVVAALSPLYPAEAPRRRR